MDILKEFADIAGAVTNPAIEEWKAQGRKAIGFLCSHVPEEILYAADILPYRLRGPGCRETTSADVYMGHVNCTFVKSCLEYVLTEKYDFLDGLVYTNSCDHSRRLYDVIRATKGFPFMHFISVPHKTGGAEVALWYRDEFNLLKENIERTFGVEITPERLKDAVEVYNESRRLLQQMYDLRRRDRPPLTGAQAMNVLLAASSMPRDQFNAKLQQLLGELSTVEGISDHKARLMIAGSGGCDNPAFYDVIEEQGGLIVTDSLCFGSRYFWEPVEIEDDLLLALALAYIKRPSCALMTDGVAERSEFVMQMTRDFNVDGVVYQRIRYCDLWGAQLIYIHRDLKDAGIPLLSLEREYALGAVGQLRTRVQAFLESIG